MSDRFDTPFDHMLDTKPGGDDAGEGSRPARRAEVITDGGRRRQWSTDEKARVLFESLVPGANVSAVARRHGMSPQQLFGWRREARDEMAADAKAKRPDRAAPDKRGTSPQSSCVSAPAFVPVMIAAPASAPTPPPPAAPCAGRIEIVVGDCLVRVCGDVDTKTLTSVLAAVRRSR